MARKKSYAASKISSSAAPAISSTTQTAHKSSILHSRFLPSRYQLPLFASVIQGLDSQHLRIHDTTTARLQCEHAIQSRATINCLDWGYYGKIHRDQDLELLGKRKRGHLVNGNGSNSNARDVVLAFGTSDSEINMFSPARATIAGVLKGAHTKGIKDFKFTDWGRSQEGWSLGGDGKLVQWNLLKGTSIRSLAIPGPNATSLSPLTSALICASHNAYLIDLDSGQSTSYTASINPIHTIICSSSDSSHGFSFLTAAESDNFLTVFEKSSDKSNGMLRTENEAISLDLYLGQRKNGNGHEKANSQDPMRQPQEVLLAVNKDGALEIFPSPFSFNNSSTGKDSESLKSRMKQRTRKASALVKIIRPDKTGTVVPLLGASFQGNEIVMAWTEGGINLVFDRIPWREEGAGNLLIVGRTEIVKERGGASIGATVMNGVKDMGRTYVDQSHAMIINGGDSKYDEMVVDQPVAIDVSSGDSDSEFETELVPKRIARFAASDVEMEDAPGKDDDDGNIKHLRQSHQAKNAGRETTEIEDSEEHEIAEEPSFGELLRTNAPEPVDVQAAFPVPQEQALHPVAERVLTLPSGMSLGTVLTQSLRTNDLNLLETCFHVRELPTVRATIERLDSSLATILLQKLAERLHGRPGRAGSLMVWIQWTLIAHGAYLAGQPELMKKLASLYRVVKERSNSLQSLLSLKGKLDMLEAQMNLRKSMQARSRAFNAPDEEDEEGVIYVEGQEESSSRAKGMDLGHGNSGKAYQDDESDELESDGEADEEDSDEDDEDDDDDEEDGVDEVPTTMPAITNGVEVSSEASDSEEPGHLNDEASSTDQDSGDDASSDILNHDSIDSAISSEDSPPPKKRISRSKLSNGILLP